MTIGSDLTYIYTLNDPYNDEIRYVGKTDNLCKRLNEHIRKSNLSKTHKNNWIQHLLKNGKTPTIEILDIVPKNEWTFWEIYWIDLLKSWNINLTNIAYGGIGGDSGEVTRMKISEKLKGIVRSKETIEKYRISHLNKKHLNITKKKMSLNHTGLGNPMFGKTRTESSKTYRKVIQLDIFSNPIKEWNGLSIASKELKINRCTISDVCNNRKKTAGGYKWKYAK